MRASALGRTNALAVSTFWPARRGRACALPSHSPRSGGARVAASAATAVPDPAAPSDCPSFHDPDADGAAVRDGRTAIPPAAAPQEVKDAIYAANRIVGKPYRYGGGHRRFNDSGYDCSGSVSFALRGGGLVKRPLHSTAFMGWGEAGKGTWITVYTNPGHAFAIIAGLRFDTSGPGPRGPNWRKTARSSRAYTARHPVGF